MNDFSTMPGYVINEYRLTIPLPEVLREKITDIRNKLHEKYKVKSTFELQPGLTILKCYAFDKVEPRLIERMQQIAMEHNPFKVELENFAAYPSHTIYIDVPTKSPFNELTKSLKKMKWLMNIPQQEPHFINEPHLIIAQRLKPMQFINLWLECEHSSFSGRFMADRMVLLKRNAQVLRYEVVREMEFMNLPLHVKQGELFA
jgi:2'-5' RNA ligase